MIYGATGGGGTGSPPRRGNQDSPVDGNPGAARCRVGALAAGQTASPPSLCAASAARKRVVINFRLGSRQARRHATGQRARYEPFRFRFPRGPYRSRRVVLSATDGAVSVWSLRPASVG